MTKEQQFWEWFRLNETTFFFLNQINDENEKERILDDFLAHLHEYCGQLFFEIGGYPDKKQDLIITAEGNVDFFEKVEDLVDSAPILQHWNVIAFKPIMGFGNIECNDIILNPETMYFSPLLSEVSPKIGLRVYIDNFNPTLEKDYLQAVYLLLDIALGEKSAALDIGYVDVISLPSEREELIDFIKLPRYIKWKKSSPNN